MRRERLRRARRLIGEYGLHSSVPVSLWRLEDMFPVRRDDLGGMDVLGMVLNPSRGWDATPDNPARVVINIGLDDYSYRLTYAHEVGHAVCRHVGFLSSKALGMEDRHEREAWEIAAALLIPERVVMEERDVDRIAAVCSVPKWLVSLWPF